MTTREATRGVNKLAPTSRESGDRIFEVRCDCGTKVGWTKLSRKAPGADLGNRLPSIMAHQLGISLELWRLLAGCQRGRPDYLEAVRANHECSGRRP